MSHAPNDPRAEEQLSEADAWIELTGQFFQRRLGQMRCPHCASAEIGALVHPNGCTLKCLNCGRFTHARGRPSWAQVGEAEEFVPVKSL